MSPVYLLMIVDRFMSHIQIYMYIFEITKLIRALT